METNAMVGRSLSLRPWGRGWCVRELAADGDRRLLRGGEKRRALRILGAYRRGDRCRWPRTKAA